MTKQFTFVYASLVWFGVVIIFRLLGVSGLPGSDVAIRKQTVADTIKADPDDLLAVTPCPRRAAFLTKWYLEENDNIVLFFLQIL